jgi:hypothetical protein
MRPIASALVALTLLSGCYNVHVRTTADPAQRDTHETTVHFINGLTASTIRATECSRGIAAVDFKIPWWNPLLSFLSFGIVGAAQTTYTCVKGGRGSAEAPESTAPVAAADSTGVPSRATAHR